MKSKALILLITGMALLLITSATYLIPQEEVLEAQALRAEPDMPEERTDLRVLFFGISTGFIISSLLIYVLETRQVLKLSREEQIIYNYVKQNGKVYQSSIAKKYGWSKAKVSRNINKLEFKGLIKKEQKGMTNEVSIR